MTEKEALKLAQKALSNRNAPAKTIYEALHAIKEALMSVPDGAQPEQEPVAHTLNCVCGAVWDIKADGSEEMAHTPDTTPPQRPSRSDIKPLTDEEIILIVADCASSHQHTDIHFARAIEAAHGIKE